MHRIGDYSSVVEHAAQKLFILRCVVDYVILNDSYGRQEYMFLLLRLYKIAFDLKEISYPIEIFLLLD